MTKDLEESLRKAVEYLKNLNYTTEKDKKTLDISYDLIMKWMKSYDDGREFPEYGHGSSLKDLTILFGKSKNAYDNLFEFVDQFKEYISEERFDEFKKILDETRLIIAIIREALDIYYEKVGGETIL